MKINPEKILKHAEARLKIQIEEGNKDWVQLFKTFLKIENHRLLMAHRNGAEGLQVAKDRSCLVDVMITHILRLTENEQQAQFPEASSPLAVVALGGYGRQELNPCSDIDILFLLKSKPIAADDPFVKRILYLLWDTGFKVGHAVRTTSDAIEEGRRDFKSRTSMMEARYITGDAPLFNEFKKTFSQKCLLKDIPGYVERKMEDTTSRHAKYKETVYLQEPHIKEGVGGLRDLSSCLWIYETIAGYQSFQELLEKGILSKNDFKALNRSINFLHRVRNELHFTTEKCFDILSLALQPKIAKNLGYCDSPPLKMSEIFMKDYYFHARNIDRICKDLLARNEVQTQLKIRFPQRYVERHGLAFTEEVIFPGKDEEIFAKNPVKLFEIFLYCTHGNYQLSQGMVQQIRQNLYLVDKKVQSSREVRDIFITLLNYEGSIIRSLRAMHDTGLLGKYFPEFGKATCFVQHDFYHQYTLDEHTLRAVEFLDELKRTTEQRLGALANLFKEIHHKDVAFLAVLFHDIGKIHGKDHSVKGAKMVVEILSRIQYPQEKIERVRLLVEHHLIMAHLSQRRDLSEEKVIIDFSKKIGDVENLRILQLLTYADSNATGEGLWSEWKEALLWELYYKTKRYLEEKVVLLPSEVQAIKDSYVEILAKQGIPERRTREHLEMLPTNYLQAYGPDTLQEHLKMIDELAKTDPRIFWTYHAATNATELTLLTKDHVGLFSEITGSIACQAVNILSANIFTRKDGIAIDKFSLEGPFEKNILPERTRSKIEQNLFDILQKRKTMKQIFMEKLSSQPSPAVTHAHSIIKFDNEASLSTSILEIQTDDQIGFLYKVTRTLAKLGLNIHLAKIATEKAQIYDVFYISDCDGKKIDPPQVQTVIIEEIQKAIQTPVGEL